MTTMILQYFNVSLVDPSYNLQVNLTAYLTADSREFSTEGHYSIGDKIRLHNTINVTFREC